MHGKALILVALMILAACDNSAEVGVGTDGGVTDNGGSGVSGLPKSKVIADLSTEEAVTLCTWAGELNKPKDGGDDGSRNPCKATADPGTGLVDDRRLISAVRQRSACITDLRWLETAHGCKIPVKGFEACAKAAALLPPCTVPLKLPECTAEAMCVAAGTANPFGFKAFKPRTRSFAAVGLDEFYATIDGPQLSLTDAGPNEGCHLATDINAGLLDTGQQVIITLDAYKGTHFCPTGSHVVRSDCPATHDRSRTGFSYGPARCAYYRRWKNGNYEGTVKATAGWIKVSLDGDKCHYEVRLKFGEGELSDAFDLSALESPTCTPAASS